MFEWLYKKEKVIPQPGEFWLFISRKTEDPWGYKNFKAVKILEVKDGWVRYAMSRGEGHFFQDERLSIKEFIRMYTKEIEDGSN